MSFRDRLAAVYGVKAEADDGRYDYDFYDHDNRAVERDMADRMATATARAESEAVDESAKPGKWHAATVAKLCRNPNILRAAAA